jgi:hypothetical protein
MSSLTNQIDEEIEARIQGLTEMFQQAYYNVEDLAPQINRLEDQLGTIETLLSGELLRNAQVRILCC